MKNGFLAIFAVFVFFSASLALGQDFPVPDVDPFPALLDLIKDWRSVTPLGIGMAIIVIFIQMLKSFAFNFKYSRLAVVVLSVIYAALLKYSEGLAAWDAIITTFIVGGGAVAIYEAWKGLSQLVLKK